MRAATESGLAETDMGSITKIGVAISAGELSGWRSKRAALAALLDEECGRNCEWRFLTDCFDADDHRVIFRKP